MIRVEPVMVGEDPHGRKVWAWTWNCTCHPGLTCVLPWPEKPSTANAAAEHDLLAGVRTLQVRAGWVR